MKKRCQKCGEPYYRRNLAELWIRRNPGHRKGWQKAVAKICNPCLSSTVALRILMVAQVRVGRLPSSEVKALAK